MLEGFTRFRDSMSEATQGISSIMGLIGGVGGAFAIPTILRYVPSWQMFIHSGNNFTILQLVDALLHAAPAAIFSIVVGAGSAWAISAGITEGIVRAARYCRQSCACCNRAPDPDLENIDIEMQHIPGHEPVLNPPAILHSRQIVLQRALTGEDQDMEFDQDQESERLIRLEN